MPASPSTARAINDRLALGLLQDKGPLTAGQLKQLTGLSRPTVADLVERLGAAGLITVVGESGAARRGPNARLYGIAADRAHLAALDVRTEGVAVLVADLVGRVLVEAAVPIEGDTGTGPAVQRVVAAVAGAVGRAGAEGLHTVGIGAPGLIDPATGDLRDSAGLPAWHRSLSAALQERLPGARVTVENETNLAALAEQREGAARDRDTFVLLWLGHGTGAAVVLDGTLRRGASGGTGEIGFLPVPGTPTLPSATDCSGGFHTLAGAAAVASLGAEHGLPTPSTTDGPGAAGMVRGAVERVLAAGEPAGSRKAKSEPGAGEPVGAWRACGGEEPSAADESTDREPAAAADPAGTAVGAERRFLSALADRIAIGAASVVAVLDPGCVVLGGEIGHAGGDVLAGLVAQRLRRMSPLPTEVRAGTLGGSAVLRGALLTARDRAQDTLWSDPSRSPVPS
ncbi:ROK family transcriptional regulator [Streptomyces murinus]|uniref:Putative NBD/HSP70 family sugar kinase n=1 Tax=Streptomyces murinus TaxID=33900 RepID=A0A7W3NL05_STRMR|nr:ROK family transcriptional regulator [Streptomyces murinus]MBA9052446.1 putative NBD/HSP70 family sugar kinase [Streptomyces murinus]UWW93677.1 ROK family protein [Streptomyces murinus]WSI84352.1 ROK family transcriptional regulator [Streptomyces murinus]